MKRTIFLASPREPSGATWLINCLIELGVCCFRHYRSSMWEKRNGRDHLRPHEDLLKRWLPALSRHAERGFRFNTNLEVQWDHCWPHRNLVDLDTIFFVRDPRDALYSRYRRVAPELDFVQYAMMPDAHTLLSRVDNWCLFNRCWLSRRNIHIVRFEDYKRDAHNTLRNVIKYLGLDVTDREIEMAVTESDFAKARDAEARYLSENHQEEKSVINRAGKVGSWSEMDENQLLPFKKLEERGSDVMTHLGYDRKNNISIPDFGDHMDAMPFFDSIPFRPSGDYPVDIGKEIEAFVANIDAEFLKKARLDPSDGTALLCNMRDYLRCKDMPSNVNFDDLLVFYGNLEGNFYYEMFKRTRNLRDLKRIGSTTLVKLVLGKIWKWKH